MWDSLPVAIRYRARRARDCQPVQVTGLVVGIIAPISDCRHPAGFDLIDEPLCDTKGDRVSPVTVINGVERILG